MKIKLLSLSLMCYLGLFGQKTGSHAYSIDLTNVVDDRVKVSLNVTLLGLADQNNNSYLFHFPATIPGTYATLDYGRFIHDFKAYNASGEKLKTSKRKNSYTIKGKPDRIEYWAGDSFYAKIRKNKVFEPAGTNNQ